MSILKFKKKNSNKAKYLFEYNNLINIRLHPTLNKEMAIKKITEIISIPKNIKLGFINNSEENISDSIKQSKYCVFGLSSYINLALSLNSNVFVVNTNHLYDPPIDSRFLKSGKFFSFNPW